MNTLPRTVVYFADLPEHDRWFRGDRNWRRVVRRWLRGPEKIGGIKLVFLNAVLGLREIGADFAVNLPFEELRGDDRVVALGQGPASLRSYAGKNPVVAGIGVVDHPLEWPTMLSDVPVTRYLVHSEWVQAMFARHLGAIVKTWAAGIDTQSWAPDSVSVREDRILLYDKIRWSYPQMASVIRAPIERELARRGIPVDVIRYGAYRPNDFRRALSRSKGMIFLCEHETQGLAYQQAMSSGIPILAWDPGHWMDPNRFRYGESHVPASTVPFFDERCGLTFRTMPQFPAALDAFWAGCKAGRWSPRDYVLENLTLAKSARDLLKIVHEQ